MVERVISDLHYKMLSLLQTTTQAGRIEWEETAIPLAYAATLGDDYVIIVSQLDSFDESPEPDYQLVIMNQNREVIRLDYRDFDLEEFKARFGELPYLFIRDIWQRAHLKASRLQDDLERINRQLGKRLDK